MIPALLAAKAFMGKVPRWAWFVGAAALILAVGSCVHHGRVKAHDKALIAARDAEWTKALAKAHDKAIEQRKKREAENAAISQNIRTRHEETLRGNSALAGDLLRGGAGQARCRQGDHPGISSSTSGHDTISGATSAASTPVSPDDRAAVPWPWLVGVAHQCDDNRSEVVSWREWYARQSQAAANVNPR